LQLHTLTGLERDIAGCQRVRRILLFVDKPQSIFRRLHATGHGTVVQRQIQQSRSRRRADTDADGFSGISLAAARGRVRAASGAAHASCSSSVLSRSPAGRY